MAVEEKREDFKGRNCEEIKRPRELQKLKTGIYNSGYPPNVTVDELWIYRKRRPAFTWPKDNLKLEEGEFKSLKTEYKRRFKNFYNAINKSPSGKDHPLRVQPSKPEITLKLEGLHDFHSEYNESFTEQPMKSLTQPSKCVQIMDNGISTSQLPAAETTSQLNKPFNIVRPRLIKRPTNLKIEGDFLHVTEYAEKFIEYLLAKRSELLRTPTTLRLEGEMDTKTETRDQFIKYDRIERPPLCKNLSNLHLEGNREGNMTEKQDKFTPFEVTKRPHLTKKVTNLHLEGDLNLIPEYRRQYIDYKTLDRPKLVLPTNNLKIGGLFESFSDELNPRDRRKHPLIPFLRESDKTFDDSNKHRKTPTRTSHTDYRKSASHPNLSYVLGNNVPLEGNVEIKTEPKNSYIDFSKHGKISPKVESRRHSELKYMDVDTKLEIQPEYNNSYLQRQKSRTRKPEGEVYHLTEKNENYVPHNFIEKIEQCKSESELKEDGRFQCQPEYRKAYIDYLIRERKPESQKRRAFELIPKDNQMSDQASPDDTSENGPILTKDKEISSNTQIENLSNLNIPSKDSSSSASSVVSRPRSTTKEVHLRKLSQVEASAFGPRCIQSKFRESLTPSPTPHAGRGSRCQVPSRDLSPKLITESTLVPQRRRNLSYSPTIKKIATSKCHDWNGSVDTDTAFFVLDEKVPSKRIATNNLYKEQKWMPSWNYSNQ